MIDLIDVQWKNFLSYGNNFTTFEFQPGVTRLLGENGKGKSVLIEVIYYALFGKPYRKINLKQIVNSKNKKDLYVILRFRKGEDSFRIERGSKPEIFKIFKNDELVPVSSSKRGYQQILEEDITHINENLFNQIGIKSLTKNMSFMALSKAEKRNVIENIFDIELFTSISRLIKSKVDLIDMNISSLKKDIENTDLLIEHEIINLDNLRKIQQKIEEESKVKLDELESEIKKINEENKKYNVALGKIESAKQLRSKTRVQIASSKDVIKFKRDEQVGIQANIKAAANKIRMFETTCSGCSKIKELLKAENIDEQQEKYKQLEVDLKTEREKIATLEQTIEKCDAILANEKFIVGNIERNNRRIIDIENSMNIEVSREINVDETKLKDHKVKLVDLKKLYNEFGLQKKHYQVLKSLYADDGIKAFIIKKYLPTINQLLNSYLNKFNAGIIFNFDSEFNEVVLSKDKEDFTYFSFSEGQKKRIDMAVLFAFINFSMFKNKKSNINLLIFDEILGGLDGPGRAGLHEVLKEFKQQHNKSIITISHDTDIDPDNFDRMYNVEMVKGFSQIKLLEE